MTEDFLHYVWRTKLFDTRHLRTTSGDQVHILHTGVWNHHDGPDFCGAQIRIGNILWVGNVEIHVRTSQWRQHGHHHNDAYRNVILHVVYENDTGDPINHDIPVLELKHYVSFQHYRHYQTLLQHADPFPCSRLVKHVPKRIFVPWQQRMLVERLLDRATPIKQLLAANKNDWQQTLYQSLAAAFGNPSNKEPFAALTQAIPWRIVNQRRNNLFQVESIFFGASGLLDGPLKDAYPRQLAKEFAHWKRKYQIRGIAKLQWKFSGVRPAAFPTLRIAQFAALLTQSDNLINEIIFCTNPQTLGRLFCCVASAYWNNHYRFDRPTKRCQPKRLGQQTIDSLITNLVVPFLFVYGKAHGQEDLCERALRILEQLPPERNQILSAWQSAGVAVLNAGDSQALIHLKKTYCNNHRCLECAAGNYLISGRG